MCNSVFYFKMNNTIMQTVVREVCCFCIKRQKIELLYTKKLYVNSAFSFLIENKFK